MVSVLGREVASDVVRQNAADTEPRSLRTYTPTGAVLAESAGVYHWTPEGRRLYDFTSGVLVANLGHNPRTWLARFQQCLDWPVEADLCVPDLHEFVRAAPMTAYNAVTPIEVEANRRLLAALQAYPSGRRLESILWAASGSEAVHKALHAALARDPARQGILASRHGFHGKKGIAWAVSGSEADPERDPRVRYFDFPRDECRDLSQRNATCELSHYERQWEGLIRDHGETFAAVITEPYLGGGGSFHPPAGYLQALQHFCRRHDILLILDEVQSNFGRTGEMFAYQKYGLEPDIVVLGKGLGNGVPVAAAVGPRAVFDRPGYGEMSDTWSGNPLSSAAVVATLDQFSSRDILGPMRESSAVLEAGLVALKAFPFIAHVRGEEGGMVWGVETADWSGRPAAEWANQLVLEAYRGAGGPADDGVHLLGPLAKKVVRVSPPLVITPAEADASTALLRAACERLLARGSS